MTKKAILFFIYIYICNFSLCYAGKDYYHNENASDSIDGSFMFGIVADIQYADKDSLKGRYYRATMSNLEECVTGLNKKTPTFTVQLGDIIDGFKEDLTKTHTDLDSVIGVISRLNMPLFHVIGNHDLLAGTEYLKMKLGMENSYYDFTIPSANRWRFIVLDGNDGGYGIMTDTQIAWFRETINQAEKNREKVICFCHYALVADANMHHYMAQPEPILKIIDDTHCVVTWFAGHDHKGGYAYRNGVHHVTVKGMVEAPTENSYAIIEVFSDKIQITGIGKEENRELQFKNITKQ